ncbi:hypothetical protein EVAR_86137_1 [Eumeta japonica]|uniref:Uncharacterized protein n=1 Tax=Eumeta variegata TaxID=151549 RepID=A0A4C1V2I8_EUMVA|nr:hypothetical protein EVAR_86137_1 [Eumeta japonica]
MCNVATLVAWYNSDDAKHMCYQFDVFEVFITSPPRCLFLFPIKDLGFRVDLLLWALLKTIPTSAVNKARPMAQMYF